MHFSIKLPGAKSVYIQVLHHLSKFGEHRFMNKKNITVYVYTEFIQLD